RAFTRGDAEGFGPPAGAGISSCRRRRVSTTTGALSSAARFRSTLGEFRPRLGGIFANQRDRRNLTPDQLALVMGRHYNRVKLPAAERARRAVAARGTSPEKQDGVKTQASYRLATLYGVGHDTIEKAGKFAAAVETLKAVDPEIEAR
ncbi:MAG TPA: hypothetical protein PLL76_22105, partial [Thermoanaerobaculia bacterium]|nr:hypothetical protein [Thermoanaerobaculia bacterium]